MPERRRLQLAFLLERYKRVEEEKLRIFAAQRSAYEQSSRDLERLAETQRMRIVELTTNARNSGPIELRIRDAHLSHLERAIEGKRRQTAELAPALTRARDELVAAGRARGVIEKLAERRRRAIEQDARRREQLELDEGNARRHGRARL